MKRSGIKRQRSQRAISYADELQALTPALIARAHGLCEICGYRGGTVRHHRLRRGQGGKNTLANLLLLCETDHSMVHANPQKSYEKGWLIRRKDVDLPSYQA